LDRKSDQIQGMGARRIYDALRDQILGGVYGEDGVLPSSRSLALELGVSRTTVTVAYEQLLAEGFIVVQQGARARVAPSVIRRDVRAIPIKHDRALRLSAYGKRISAVPPWLDYVPSDLIVDFRYGDLAPSDFPAAAWRRAVNATAGPSRGALAYDDPRGSQRLRMALQGYLWRARTLRCDFEQIIVVNGSQQGLDLCARLLLDEADPFAIENPCYAMARRILAATGACPVSIATDRDGLNTNQLRDVAARLAYVTPSHQFPLGGVMPVSRRRELLDWARRNDAYVIEDDYDSEFRYDISPVPPMHVMEGGDRVIYLGTVSKTLSPRLRIGYLVVPPALQEVFATAKQLTDRHSPLSDQEALASFIEGGAYERHVRRVRRLNGERRQTLLGALRLSFADRINIEGADAGLHIVVWFKDLPRSSETKLVEEARRKGVGVHSISSLYAPDRTNHLPENFGLVMGYAALETKRIERGIHLLAEAVVETKTSRPPMAR